MYLLVQQTIRLSANDPQIQIAQDIKITLIANKPAAYESLIDIKSSLSPFIMVFDMKGNTITSQASLFGKTPKLPDGVFSYTKTYGQDRFTWQPTSGVRIAAVIIAYPHGYILVGRNIEEIENREQQLEYITFAGWLTIVLLTTGLLYIHKKI